MVKDRKTKLVKSIKQPQEPKLAELNKKSKLVSGDLDFVHERIELLKNLTSLESHSWSAYVRTVIDDLIIAGFDISNITKAVVQKAMDEGWGDEEEKRRFGMFRKLRRDYMIEVVDMNVHEGWCRSKHMLEAMMRLQENAARYEMLGQNAKVKKCAMDYRVLYQEFLKLNNLA